MPAASFARFGSAEVNEVDMLTAEQVADLKEVYKIFDKDDDGTVTFPAPTHDPIRSHMPQERPACR